MIYTIENKSIKATLSSQGATLLKLEYENRDVVIGFDNEKDYKKNSTIYAGATIGRCANRIGKGKFTINGIEYHSPINNGPNSLHGGEGFAYVEFAVKRQSEEAITFTYHDADLNNGYPGNLDLDITYRLNENTLFYEIEAICDKDSMLNITNHSYFNLDGKGDILNHEFKIYTDKVAINDEDGMATDKVINTEGTSFDFIDFRKFKDNFNLKHDNLVSGGIDHNFVFENMDDKVCCELRNDDISLTVKSDLPDIHVYTACGFDGFKGKNDSIYNQYGAVALECQYYPNAINYDSFIKPIIKKNEKVKHYISYTLERR